jgi:hypothetical protein
VAGGCATNHPVKGANTSEKAVLVTPIVSHPVTVLSSSGMTLLAPGPPGVAEKVEYDATIKQRMGLSEYLNRQLPDFLPEKILAEECVRELQASSRQPFRGVELSNDSKLMEGAAEFLKGVTRPFAPEMANATRWISISTKWRKSLPRADSLDTAPAGQKRLRLEVCFFTVTLNFGKNLEMTAFLRLVDPEQGKILGMTGYVGHNEKVTPLSSTSDARLFVEEFRRCANKVAQQGLKELKLI